MRNGLIFLGYIGHTNCGNYLIIDLTNNCVYDAPCGLRNSIYT
ncbi:hypothetical protein ACIN7338_0133 [Acinetobacter baumannii OIFC338]|nr:hypothetical protein C7R87_3178 [Acinetobacter baumannii]ELX03535.1 hypothetical protein ACIN7338_0133 [Acinetobacter baumannii OIFC338]ETR58460.1 hypothetical protein V427_2065 [Acinetobacter baumannii UH10707]EXH39880.1 hypothetical protein J651_3294 [Acinetobacter baumannii 1293320]